MSKTVSGGGVPYGYYLVAYIDILGQSDEWERLAAIPHGPEHQGDAVAVLKKTVGSVRSARAAFQSFFNAAIRGSELSAGMDPAVRAEMNRMRPKTFHQIGFSDSFVISIPLDEDRFGAATPAMAVASALFGIAGTMLSMLSAGIPLRAGVDVERGIEAFGPGEVYGLGLVRAYQLESKKAKYPRAVVGAGLLHYLSYLESLKDDALLYNRLAASMSPLCRRLVTVAPDDGLPMLHMLSDDIVKTVVREDNALPERARDWAEGCRRRFHAAGDLKLESYYSRLLQYFQAHGY